LLSHSSPCSLSRRSNLLITLRRRSVVKRKLGVINVSRRNTALLLIAFTGGRFFCTSNIGMSGRNAGSLFEQIEIFRNR